MTNSKFEVYNHSKRDLDYITLFVDYQYPIVLGFTSVVIPCFFILPSTTWLTARWYIGELSSKHYYNYHNLTVCPICNDAYSFLSQWTYLHGTELYISLSSTASEATFTAWYTGRLYPNPKNKNNEKNIMLITCTVSLQDEKKAI